MVIQKTYRFRLKPKVSQRILFARFAGSCRYMYNKGLALSIETYERKKKRLSYADLCKEVTRLKKLPETEWLSEPHSQALQQSLKDLESAFKHFFRRRKAGKKKLGFPVFKKRGNKDSFRYPQGVKVVAGKVFLPKIGLVSYFDSQPIEGKIAQATVKREGKHWFVNIACTLEQSVTPVSINESSRAIGIDVGIKHLATLSDGTHIENPKYLRNAQAKLAYEQRALMRKKKGSNNRRKQAAKVAQLHIKIKNCRKDVLHKASTDIVKNHDIIAVETLNISGMMQNHNLAQSIADVGWRSFQNMLEYKSKWQGKHFVKIPRFYPSSQTCSRCMAKQPMPLNIRTYNCAKCCAVIDRDLNASINILAAGHAVLLACGGNSGG